MAGLPSSRDRMETHFEIMERTLREEAGAKLLNDLDALAVEVEELMAATVGETSEKAKEVRARLSVAMERVKTTCLDFERRATAGARAADKAIRANPYQSAGVAFGLGLLIGVLATRR